MKMKNNDKQVALGSFFQQWCQLLASSTVQINQLRER
jgi:hypothetical protein